MCRIQRKIIPRLQKYFQLLTMTVGYETLTWADQNYPLTEVRPQSEVNPCPRPIAINFKRQVPLHKWKQHCHLIVAQAPSTRNMLVWAYYCQLKSQAGPFPPS